MYKIIFSLLITLGTAVAHAAPDTLRVLFIGNSYTAVNNLPQMFTDMAASGGHAIIADANMPGGYTLQQHSTNSTTLAKIAQGNWDYVVLQEQSQYPSFPDQQVESEVYPYARMLDSLVQAQNPCAQTVFYMTWGRKNGDAANCAFFPPLCTYQGMDSLLRLRYTYMAQNNGAVLAPAGAVWRYLRATQPGIELYQNDESHPSVAGTYAVAAAFYASLLRQDPAPLSFTAGLDANTAMQIRQAASTVAFDSLSYWRQYVQDPAAAFTFSTAGTTATYSNTSANADSYQWFFGDGQTSATASSTHTYAANGTYQVTLVASHCKLRDTATQTVTVTGASGIAGIATQQGLYSAQDGATLWIHMESPLHKQATLALYNSMGQEVAMLRLEPGATRAAIPSLAIPAGLYVAVLSTPAGNRQVLRVAVR